MHFTGFAVKAQGEFFLALGDGHGFGAHGALHAGDALGLLGAEAQGKTHTVLGDHEAGFAQLFMAFVGSVDDLSFLQARMTLVEQPVTQFDSGRAKDTLG